MGHRCNYVVRERGVLTLYYSHWGALTVPRDLFWGLAAARAFFAGHDACADEDWLDDVWGEGGAALDVDGQTLTIYGGEIYGPARELLIELMSAVWARDNFRVRDASSFIDIALAVGLPASTVEASHLPSAPLDVSDAGQNGREDGYARTLVVVDGEPRFARTLATSVLELGAARAHELRQLPDLAESKALWETHAPPEWEVEKLPLVERLCDALVIDTRAKRLEASEYQLRRGTSRAHYETLWPGYELVPLAGLDEVLARLEHPDLPPPVRPPPRPTADLLGEIEKFLFGSRSDPATWFASIVEQQEGGWVNPHALVSPVDGRPRDATQANLMFRAVVHEVLAKRR